MKALPLLAVLALALAVRLPAHAQMAAARDTFAPVVDSEAYLLQALRVAAGRDMSDEVYFQAPLYPWILGLCLRAASVPGAVGVERAAELPAATLERALAVGRRLNLVCGLLLVLLMARLGTVLFGFGAGLAAATLVALHAPFVFYEGHILKVSLSLLFLPWATLAVARAERLGRPGGYLWAGLALGAGGLVRGNMHPLVALGVLALLVAGFLGLGLGPALRRAGALALGAALALAPVVVRNSLVAGEPVLSTAAGGTAFYLCNHAGNSTGLVEYLPGNRQVPRHELGDWRLITERELGRPVSPAEISRYWRDRALADIAADPGRWLLVELRKLGLLFSRYEAPDNALFALGEESAPLLAWLPGRWGLVVPLACGGIVLAWLLRRQERLSAGHLALALLGAGYAGTLLLFVVSDRFRMPLAVPAMIAAGYLLARLGALLGPATSGRRRVAVGLAALAGLTLGHVSEGPLGPLDEVELSSHLVMRLKNRAQVALDRGDVAAARTDLERALRAGAEVQKVAPDVLVLLGVLDRAEAAELAAEGRADEAAARRASAIGLVDAALEASPDHPLAQRTAGLLLWDEGERAQAAGRFRRTLATLPGDRDARVWLTWCLLEMGQAPSALTEAEELVRQRPDHDDGHGLLALARARAGDPVGARAALAEHDRLVALREQAGQPPRLPELAEFVALRAAPPVGDRP